MNLGASAPDFSLKATGGREISLSEFRHESNVVLLFFPFAFSPVCTDELCSVRDGYSAYGELDAQVLGISVDSPFVLQSWSDDQGFPFPLVSDFNKEVSASYDVLYEDLGGWMGVSKRAAFVVDREGIVRYAEVCPTPKHQPDFERIRECLTSLE